MKIIISFQNGKTEMFSLACIARIIPLENGIALESGLVDDMTIYYYEDIRSIVIA